MCWTVWISIVVPGAGRVETLLKQGSLVNFRPGLGRAWVGRLGKKGYWLKPHAIPLGGDKKRPVWRGIGDVEEWWHLRRDGGVVEESSGDGVVEGGGGSGVSVGGHIVVSWGFVGGYEDICGLPRGEGEDVGL
ncbi:hypothetical protein Syun_013764 [Stephania yunnanensis]|uniref:Uncharacterized protein n=1 Tax=Stephania yunnanensis TaxID=152371 RepID=A0AAP0JIG7_9MAGN